MDLTITIPQPVLVSGETFKVRYRTHPAGSWTTLSPNKTNSPFTVTGLSAGVYDFEFTLVRNSSPLVECDPVIKTFTVVEESDCIEAEGAIPRNGDIYTLTITYTGTANACYYEVEYGPVGGPLQVALYNTLPASPFTLPASNASYSVVIRACDCNGTCKKCYEGTVDPPTSCEAASVTAAELVYVNGVINIHLTIVQSTPPTTTFTVSYHQNNMVTAGVPDPGGTIQVSATPSTTQLYIPVNPNLNVVPTNGELVLFYYGSLTDRCNNSTKFTASLVIS